MRKPEGKAEAGWYDHPTEDGYEKYWNGKFWSTKVRKFGEEGPMEIPVDQKYLGRFLFRFPIKSDGAFIAYLVTVAVGIFYGFRQEVSSGDGLAIVVVALLGALVTVPWVYILFLVFLILI